MAGANTYGAGANYNNGKTGTGAGVVIKDASGKVLNDLEYREAEGRGDKLTASWQDADPLPPSAAIAAEASPGPPAPAAAPAAAVAAPAAAPAALQQLGRAPLQGGGAGLQEGGLTPLDSGLGVRMLPASGRALAALAARRGGRVY